MPWLESVKLMLNAVVRAGLGHVASPLGEKEVGGWGGLYTWSKMVADKGSEAIGDARAVLTAGLHKTMPDVGGCDNGAASSINERFRWYSVVRGNRS